MSNQNKTGVIIIEGHIQGLSNMRSLGEHNIPVWIIDTKDCIAMHSRYCSRFLKCPDFNSEEFINYLIVIAQKNKLKNWLLLPSNDHAAYAISKHYSMLKHHYKLITPKLSVIDHIYDKVRLIELAKKIDIPVPETYQFQSINENELKKIKYPVLTKGRNGLSFYKKIKKKALVAPNMDILRKQLIFVKTQISIGETFTQGLIPDAGTNKTSSFTGFIVEGDIKTYWMGEKLREHPLSFGTATLARSINTPELLNYSRRILRELNYTGICEIEFLKDPRDGTYKLIEINPRTWLWVGLAKSCGINYAKIAYDYVNGIPIDYPQNYPTDQYWFNPITYWVYSIKALLCNKLSLFSFVKTMGIKKDNALFVIGDYKPGFMYLLKIFKIYKNR
jgi:predicted ATP-grasp superfamily ATP-dependent carboligase